MHPSLLQYNGIQLCTLDLLFRWRLVECNRRCGEPPVWACPDLEHNSEGAAR